MISARSWVVVLLLSTCASMRAFLMSGSPRMRNDRSAVVLPESERIWSGCEARSARVPCTWPSSRSARSGTLARVSVLTVWRSKRVSRRSALMSTLSPNSEKSEKSVKPSETSPERSVCPSSKRRPWTVRPVLSSLTSPPSRSSWKPRRISWKDRFSIRADAVSPYWAFRTVRLMSRTSRLSVEQLMCLSVSRPSETLSQGSLKGSSGRSFLRIGAKRAARLVVLSLIFRMAMSPS